MNRKTGLVLFFTGVIALLIVQHILYQFPRAGDDVYGPKCRSIIARVQNLSYCQETESRSKSGGKKTAFLGYTTQEEIVSEIDKLCKANLTMAELDKTLVELGGAEKKQKLPVKRRPTSSFGGNPPLPKGFSEFGYSKTNIYLSDIPFGTISAEWFKEDMVEKSVGVTVLFNETSKVVGCQHSYIVIRKPTHPEYKHTFMAPLLLLTGKYEEQQENRRKVWLIKRDTPSCQRFDTQVPEGVKVAGKAYCQAVQDTWREWGIDSATFIYQNSKCISVGGGYRHKCELTEPQLDPEYNIIINGAVRGN